MRPTCRRPSEWRSPGRAAAARDWPCLIRRVAAARGDLAGRCSCGAPGSLWDLGRFHEAHQDLSRALPYFRRAGDTVWEARSLTARAFVFLGLGLPGRAAADFARAEELFATNGQDLEYANARHNLGLVALARGDLPEALTYLDEAGKRYQALGEDIPELAVDRCSALLAAGLAGEAAHETDTALSRIPPGGGIAYRERGAVLRRRHRRPGRGQPGRRQTAGSSGAAAVPGPGAAPLGGARQPRPRRGQVRRGEHSAALVPVRRGGRRPSRGIPGPRGDAGAPARRAHRPEPGEHARSRPAPGARRAVPPPRAAAAPERGLAGPGPAGRRAGQRPGHRRRLRARARRPRGAPDAARCHRVARVRHGARRRARHAGPARRAQAGRRPPAAVLERAMAGDRAGRPEHAAPRRQGSWRPSWKRCAA